MKRLKCLIAVTLSILCINLIGCGKEDDEAYKSVVANFLTAYQSLDSNAGEYLANQTEELQFNGVQGLLAKQMVFSVGETKKEDEGYLVTTKIRTVDFKAIFEAIAESVDENTSESAILDELYHAIEAKSPQIRTFSVDIPVQKYGEEYKIELTSELSNALLGGYNEYLSELTGGMLDE